MKTLTVIFLALVSSSAMAQNLPEVPATIVVDMTMHCPSELTQLSKTGWVYAVRYKNGYDEQSLTVDFRAGGTAPTFHSYLVGSLVVTRTYLAPLNIPDAPGTVEYKCSVIEASN